MITGTVVLSSIAVALAIGLVLCSRYMARSKDSVVDEVERILPRIQCAQCGYPGCRPYAAAIVADSAPLNLCPPGGEDTVRQLAKFLGRDSAHLASPAHAAGLAAAPANLDAVAVIDEELCIGCNLCARACPVDAIVMNPLTGSKDVLADVCVGCKVCTIACPFGTINYNQDTGKVIKCDLCGGDPQCAEACPTEAITYVPADWTGYERMKDSALAGHGRPA